MKRVLHTVLAALVLTGFMMGCSQPGSNVPTSNKQPEAKPNENSSFAPPEPVKEKPGKDKKK